MGDKYLFKLAITSSPSRAMSCSALDHNLVVDICLMHSHRAYYVDMPGQCRHIETLEAQRKN